MKKTKNNYKEWRVFWDNEARLKALGKGLRNKKTNNNKTKK